MSSRFEQDPNEIITHSPELRDAALGIIGTPLPLFGAVEISKQLPTGGTELRVIYYADNQSFMVERTDPIAEDPAGELLHYRSCEISAHEGNILSYLELIGTVDEDGDFTSQHNEDLGNIIRSALTDPNYVLPPEQKEIFALETTHDLFTKAEHELLLDAFRGLPGTN